MNITSCSFLLIIQLLFISPLKAQEVYKLWEGQPKPYYKENSVKEYEKESWGTKVVCNVTEPSLTVFKASNNNSGISVVIIPGGGYTVEAIYHEGYDLAKVLAENGITAAVLKYRLPDTLTSVRPELVPLSDSRRALQLMRQLGSKYGIDKHKVGVVGFSAGSHLATVTSLWKSKDENENPSFAGLIYGVTLLTPENKQWLEESLYFRKMSSDVIAQNTLINLVTPQTPPTFLVHAYDDNTCHVEETTLYAQKLQENKVLTEMHVFPKGGHGFGLGRQEDGTDQWVQLFIHWLKLRI